MLSPPPGAARIPGYDFSMPTEADALAALQRVFGPDRGGAMWADACRDAGVAAGRVDTLPRLERAAAALAKQGGATASIARSIEIRMRTYSRLAARGAVPSPGARP